MRVIINELDLQQKEKLFYKSLRWKRIAPMTGSTMQYARAHIKRAVEIGWIEVKGVFKSLSTPRCCRIPYKKEGIRKYEAPCQSASVGITRLTAVVMFCIVGPGVVINCTKLASGAPMKSIITMAPVTRVGNNVLPSVVSASKTSVLISSMPNAASALSGK